MREFTDIEIQLCKKIAEKERKEIERGDYWIGINKGEVRAILATGNITIKSCIPLWQEHDCLERLKEKGFFHLLIHQDRSQCLIRDGRFGKYITDKSGKTPLEALLRAVLAVMETK